MQLSSKWNCAGGIAGSTTSTESTSNSEVSCYPKATCFCLAQHGCDAESLAMHLCHVSASGCHVHEQCYTSKVAIFACVCLCFGCFQSCFQSSVSPTGAHNFNLQRCFCHIYCCVTACISQQLCMASGCSAESRPSRQLSSR